MVNKFEHLKLQVSRATSLNVLHDVDKNQNGVAMSGGISNKDKRSMSGVIIPDKHNFHVTVCPVELLIVHLSRSTIGVWNRSSW